MMIEGVLFALLAGVMLGLYALPEKYTKDFKYENTWGMFFILTMFVVPIIATYVLLGGLQVFGMVDSSIIWKMAIASFLWGTGVMMWGKAINHIGLSLGFSLFIGTVILVGSVIPFFVNGLPLRMVVPSQRSVFSQTFLPARYTGLTYEMRETNRSALGEEFF